MSNLDLAARSFANVALMPFPTPTDAELPEPLREATASYQAVVTRHREATTHLSGHHARSQAARARDAKELRKAETFTPRYEAAEAADRDKTPLLIEGLQAEAAVAEQNVRKVAVQVAEQYRATLGKQAEEQRVAVMAMTEAIKERLVELRTVERTQQWLDMVTTPGLRVKALGADLSGVDEALQPIGRLLAGPSERSLADYLANLRPGESSGPFTVDPTGVKAARQRRADDRP